MTLIFRETSKFGQIGPLFFSKCSILSAEYNAVLRFVRRLQKSSKTREKPPKNTRFQGYGRIPYPDAKFNARFEISDLDYLYKDHFSLISPTPNPKKSKMFKSRFGALHLNGYRTLNTEPILMKFGTRNLGTLGHLRIDRYFLVGS